MASNKTVLITGATGKQGGSVARALLTRGGFQVRALTRKPESPAARALARRGATIVPGDLDDEVSLRAAMDDVWGVYAMQNTWEAGVEREEAQGHRQARVAREVGVQHYVYSSVGSADRDTGIPHFENKRRIEDTVRRAEFPSHVILRPVFFMENLISPWFLNGDQLTAALPPTTSLQMVAVEDIGKMGALAFERAAELRGAEIDYAGDAATMPEVATVLSETLGRRIEFVQVPLEQVRAQSADFAAMLAWFARAGYDADIAGVQRTYGVRFLTLRDWARASARDPGRQPAPPAP